MLPATVAAWTTWFHAWFAAHWTPADLPGLRIACKLYNGVEAGDVKAAGEMRRWLDTYGITPEGQQDRRWSEPKDDAGAADAKGARTSAPPAQGPYGHLSVVQEADVV